LAPTMRRFVISARNRARAFQRGRLSLVLSGHGDAAR
jgi:hypothetical protein